MLRFLDSTKEPRALPFDDSPGLGPPAAFGAYRVLHQAGSGVVGPVFRAHDPSSDRLVAIKAITLDLLPEVAAALARELQRIASTPTGHPALAAAFDAGLERGRPFLVADFVAGESLDIARRHLTPAPLDAALRLLGDIAGAIDAAWIAGLGHGALHPRDIFIVPGAPAVRVTGVGVAAALERVGVKAPVRRPYSAPERVEGRPWDVRADVYSLGAIAQELLAGRRSAAEIDSDAFAAVPGDRRPHIREILARASAADPAGRFDSAAELVQALTAAATGEPVPAAVSTPETTESAAALIGSQPPDPIVVVPDAIHRPDRLADADRQAAEPLSLRPAAPAARAPARDAAAAHDMYSPIGTPRAPRARKSPYPWAAIAAVAIAGVALGAVGGYAVGRRSIPAAAPGMAGPSAPARDTEVAVVPPPPLPAPAPAPDVRPASRTRTLGPGRIVVRSVPAGALVTVDGRHAGETPTTIADLPFGAHTVVIGRPGYVPRTERVSLSARDVVRQLTVELQPGVDVRSAQLGSLYVDSRPRGARVSIDGRLLGTTPLSVPELSAGRHRVQLELEGHLPQTSTVIVRAGEQARVVLTLGRPAGAEARR